MPASAIGLISCSGWALSQAAVRFEDCRRTLWEGQGAGH